MGVAETGAIFKGLVFDGIDSRDFGVYITGEAVYNAPARDVEFISIPGRNGAYALDHGRYENIEVRYPAGLFASTEADFSQGISDFRNALCSRRGYCRLEDEYNPNEYRMAVYRAGLEVTPASLKAGEFEIVFDCKPQRFLTSGETEQTVTSGATITNPTLFESHPLLAVKGYGNITLNGEIMTIENAAIGELFVSEPLTETKRGTSANRTLNIGLLSTNLLNVGDNIILNGIKETIATRIGNQSEISVSLIEQDNVNVSYSISKPNVSFTVNYNTVTLSYGAASSWTTHFYASIDYLGGSEIVSVFADFVYNGTDNLSTTFRQYGHTDTQTIAFPTFSAVSTVSTLGDPTYIDLDIGEAYMINAGEVLPLNNVVNLGGELPVLNIGNNSVTYDNTITELKITPRWWKL